MKIFPSIVQAAWGQHEGPAVLATCGADGYPNAVYVSGVRPWGDDALVIADNYLHKTRANLFAGSKGALVFITPGRKSYQLKGCFTYHTEGPAFDAMKQWNPARHPGHAAVVLKIERIYCGGEQLL